MTNINIDDDDIYIYDSVDFNDRNDDAVDIFDRDNVVDINGRDVAIDINGWDDALGIDDRDD